MQMSIKTLLKYRVNGLGLQFLRHQTKQSRGVLPVITNNLEANVDLTDSIKEGYRKRVLITSTRSINNAVNR